MTFCPKEPLNRGRSAESIKARRGGKQRFLELIADALQHRGDRRRDAHGDEAVFDRGRRGFVAQEAKNDTHALGSQVGERRA